MQKFTLVDYPGKMACIVFVGNCNFRCAYCHNPCLIFDPESQPLIEEEEVFRFLATRRGKLDGVVISGGEPSLRQGLADFMRKVKQLGFFVKLDTNGSNPGKIIQNHREGFVDALGVDYKAPRQKYARIAQCQAADLGNKVSKVIKYAVDNDIFIDVRTTVHKSLLSVDDLKVMREELDRLGLGQWTLQQFNPVEVLDERLLSAETYSDRELFDVAREIGGKTNVRGLKGIFVDY
jgi:pyruvate formate lyase activating enzyme